MDRRPDSASRRRRLAALVVSVAAAAPVVAPALALRSYTDGDEYLCGDLGSLGAAIFGWIFGMIAFGVTVLAVAGYLRRARLLLVVPPVLALQFPLHAWDPQLPPVVSVCGEPMSLLVPALLVALAGGLTYALGRGAEPRGW